MDTPRWRVNTSFWEVVLGLLRCPGRKWPQSCQPTVLLIKNRVLSWLILTRLGTPGGNWSIQRMKCSVDKLGPGMHMKDAWAIRSYSSCFPASLLQGTPMDSSALYHRERKQSHLSHRWLSSLRRGFRGVITPFICEKQCRMEILPMGRTSNYLWSSVRRELKYGSMLVHKVSQIGWTDRNLKEAILGDWQ